MVYNQPLAHPLHKPFWVLLLCLGALIGCGTSAQKPAPKVPLSDVQKKFEQKARENYDLHVTTKMVGKTFWIYLPTQEPIFDYEAQKETAGAQTDKKPSPFTVQFAEGIFKENRFALEYDIIKRTKVKSEDYGYNSSYTDSYIKAQNNLFVCISDVFFNNEITDNSPKFFVMVVTDIKKGIETRATFYLDDFKRYMSGDLPYEEYMKRFIADTKGGQNFIGDETGTHIKYEDVSMTDFLSRQMVNRIRFKFERSDFTPPEDYDDTIVGIVADTARYYNFEHFAQVQLSNLRQNKKFIFDRGQLATFGEDATKPAFPAGRLIHIQFDNGKVNMQ